MDGCSTGVIYEFGSYRADTLKRQLSYKGTPLPLAPKAFDTLVLLVRNNGETVSRNDLIDTIWADTAVEENNLTQQISALRKAFGEGPGDHNFIVTVPGRGYCFVAPIRTIDPDHEIGGKHKTAFGRLIETILPTAFDRSRLIGYGLAVWFIVVVCFPVILAQFRGSASHPQSLAVLNFRSSGGDEFIGTGISDTLRARLGSVEDLTVRPVSTARLEQDAITTGRELAVDAVLTGSVQRSDEQIRVTVEMVDVAGGRIVWGGTFDAASSNIFALQDSIASEVARALKVRLSAMTGKLNTRAAAAIL